MSIRSIVFLVAALACDEAPPTTAVCVELSSVDRYVLGKAAPYPHDPTLRERESELGLSVAEQRRLGWRVAAAVLEPVDVQFAAEHRSLPRFQTWFDRAELGRLAARLSTSPSDDELDTAFARNRVAVLEAEAWPATRLADYLMSLDDQEQLRGSGGISRVVYSPRAARHLLRSRANRHACQVPPAHDSGPVTPAPSRERHALQTCSAQTLGPFRVRPGGSLQVEVPVDTTIAIRPEGACTGHHCIGTGAPFWIDVVTPPRRPTAMTVTYDREAGWVPCLDGAFPDGAAILKLDYRRVGFGVEFPVFPTDAEALRTMGAEWKPSGVADPNEDEIFTLRLPSGARYRLAAMHIMTKELDHWVWATLWWSDAPDQDFGADRPTDWRGVWNHYKLCVATHFDAAVDRSTGFPSLDEALSVTGSGTSWCSNPFLEEGPGNVATNCVGCHQHAGTELSSEEILQMHGNQLERANFPTDYVWSNPLR